MNKTRFSAWVLTGVLAALPISARADNLNQHGTNNDVPSRTGRTAMDQSNDADKVETTRRIRERIVNDKSLSTSAHNVVIVTTDDGAVTLRGPVASADEKRKIMQIANAVVPGTRVNDEISIRNNQ